SVATKKDLLVRLEAPRFFVERDQVTVSADVHNYLPNAARVRVQCDLDGGTAVPFPAEVRDIPEHSHREQWIDVPKDGERRVDWPLEIMREGALKVRVTAQSSAESDATESTFPVLVHGV